MKNINKIRNYLDKHYHIHYFVTWGAYRVIRNYDFSHCLSFNGLIYKIYHDLGYSINLIGVICEEWYNTKIADYKKDIL